MPRKRAPRDPAPRFHKRFVTRAIKTLQEANLPMNRVRFLASGEFIVSIGRPENTEESVERNEWDEVKK